MRYTGYMRPGSDNDDFAKSVWGTQYLSIRDTERLTRAGIEPSVGSRDDAYDQRPRRDGDFGDEDPWRSLEAAEFPMLARVY